MPEAEGGAVVQTHRGVGGGDQPGGVGGGRVGAEVHELEGRDGQLIPHGRRRRRAGAGGDRDSERAGEARGVGVRAVGDHNQPCK